LRSISRPSMPASPPGTMLVRSSAGCAISAPFWITRRRPGCSVKNSRPSGASTISHGTCRPEATTSVRSTTAPGAGEGAGVGAGVGAGAGAGVGADGGGGDGLGVGEGDGDGFGVGEGAGLGDGFAPGAAGGVVGLSEREEVA